MKTATQFIKTTVIGGVLFLIPLVLIVILIGKAHQAVRTIVVPIAAHIPLEHAASLMAIVLLLVVAFLTGLVARTGLGHRFENFLEKVILKKIPVYTLLKGMAEGGGLVTGGKDVKVVMANIDDAWLLAFIIEELHEGVLTVFVPSVPTPVAGSLYFLREEQVRRLPDVSVRDAVTCIMQLGVGSQALLSRAGSKTSEH
jgi:uncharacterized membrane protein